MKFQRVCVPITSARGSEGVFAQGVIAPCGNNPVRDKQGGHSMTRFGWMLHVAGAGHKSAQACPFDYGVMRRFWRTCWAPSPCSSGWAAPSLR